MALSDRFKKVTERAQRLAEQAAVELQEAAETAKTRTSELAHENRDKIGSVIDKTASTVAEHTGDRYRDRIDGVRSKAHDGLDRVADSGAPTGTIPDPAPAPPSAPPGPPDPSPTPPTPDPVPPGPDPIPSPEPLPPPEPLPGTSAI